jgi:hypothetical protein
MFILFIQSGWEKGCKIPFPYSVILFPDVAYLTKVGSAILPPEKLTILYEESKMEYSCRIFIFF